MPDYDALRDFLAREAEKTGHAALVRYDEKSGVGLLAPCFDKGKSGEWAEIGSREASPEFKGLHQRILDGEADVRLIPEPAV